MDLRLAAAASQTISGALVQHDDTAALQAIIATAPSNVNGATFVRRAGELNISSILALAKGPLDELNHKGYQLN